MTQPPKKSQRSALSLAQRSPNLTVQLTPEDVRRFRPAWDGPEAAYFMERHRAEIAAAVLAAGLLVLGRVILERESEATDTSFENK
jgi:hypothetical protein